MRKRNPDKNYCKSAVNPQLILREAVGKRLIQRCFFVSPRGAVLSHKKMIFKRSIAHRSFTTRPKPKRRLFRTRARGVAVQFRSGDFLAPGLVEFLRSKSGWLSC